MPVENCFIESFSGNCREETLNVHWLRTLDEARSILEDWRSDFNQVRPYSSLSDRVPESHPATLLEVDTGASKRAAG